MTTPNLKRLRGECAGTRADRGIARGKEERGDQTNNAGRKGWSDTTHVYRGEVILEGKGSGGGERLLNVQGKRNKQFLKKVILKTSQQLSYRQHPPAGGAAHTSPAEDLGCLSPQHQASPTNPTISLLPIKLISSPRRLQTKARLPGGQSTRWAPGDHPGGRWTPTPSAPGSAPTSPPPTSSEGPPPAPLRPPERPEPPTGGWRGQGGRRGRAQPRARRAGARPTRGGMAGAAHSQTRLSRRSARTSPLSLPSRLRVPRRRRRAKAVPRHRSSFSPKPRAALLREKWPPNPAVTSHRPTPRSRLL